MSSSFTRPSGILVEPSVLHRRLSRGKVASRLPRYAQLRNGDLRSHPTVSSPSVWAISSLRKIVTGSRRKSVKHVRNATTVTKCYASGDQVSVRFTVPSKGKNYKIVGNTEQLGSWDVGRAPTLSLTDAGECTIEVVVPSDSELHFKFVDDKGKWESGDDRVLKLPPGNVLWDGSLDVRTEFGSRKADPSVPQDLVEVRAYVMWEQAGQPSGADFGTAAAAEIRGHLALGYTAEQLRTVLKGTDAPTGPSASGHVPSGTPEAAPLLVPQSAQPPAPAPAPPPEEAWGGGAAPELEQGGSDFIATKGRWQGREISFMRSNDHGRDRHASHDTSNVHGMTVALVDGDRGAGSWRQKLEVVERLVVHENNTSTENLADIAVYLNWVSTGAVTCVEGGGHYRPCKHAEMSRNIFTAIERLDGAGARGLVVRRLHPWLPAFSAEFTASVPLTRIRDIAHRSDIPHDLKQEIKHTIQNKLHRNAGPEDLVATELMLERITGQGPQRDGGHGHYPEDFVAEFRKFHLELKDFFNASSLDEKLDKLLPDAPAHLHAPIRTFASLKAGLGPSPGAEALVEVLGAGTELRGELLAGMLGPLGSGAGDASDSALAVRQLARLAEVDLEKFAFVLLSQLENQITAGGGLAQGSPLWAPFLRAAMLAVDHVRLSNWEQDECRAVCNDLQVLQERAAAGQLRVVAGKDDALMLVAVMERARRVCSLYSDALAEALGPRAERLAPALGIDHRVGAVFCEAEIRASVVFQLSKLASAALKVVREATGSVWDALVAGDVEGTLFEQQRIVPGQIPGGGEPVILLVHEADGDEELSAAGGSLRGVVLAQELPHLSHLGVRARQEKVTFVTTEDPSTLEAVRGQLGRRVRLVASADGVALLPAGGTPAPAGAPAAPEPAPAPPPPPAPAPVPPPAPAAPVVEARAPAPAPPVPPAPPPPVPAPPPPAPAPPAAARAQTAAERFRSDPSNPFANVPPTSTSAPPPPPAPPAAAPPPAAAAPPGPAPPPPAGGSTVADRFAADPANPFTTENLLSAVADAPPPEQEEDSPTMVAAREEPAASAAPTWEDILLKEDPAPPEPAAPEPAPEAAAQEGGTEAEAAGRVTAAEVVMMPGGTVLPLSRVSAKQGGAKTASCAMLAVLEEAHKTTPAAGFRTPGGVCIPFGGMEEAIEAAGREEEFQQLVAAAEEAPVEGAELERVCEALQALVAATRPPDAVIAQVDRLLPGGGRLIVRSSANVEDLEGMSGAGLYDSICNVRATEPKQFGAAVAAVWASLFTRRAVLVRRAAGVRQADAVMSVLVQELLAPELSFVLHTAHPLSGDPNLMVAEIAVGLGETLASGARGTPWRLQVNKSTGEVQTLALANMSEALVADLAGAEATGTLVRVPVDYSKQALSLSPLARATFGRCLASIGMCLEDLLGCAQDIEGAVVEDDIYIVQARPQP